MIFAILSVIWEISIELEDDMLEQRRTRTVLFAVSLTSLLAGCATFLESIGTSATGETKTFGEVSSGYTYVPIDPFAVEQTPGRSCGEQIAGQPGDPQSLRYKQKRKYKELLASFPDNAVRNSVEQFDSKGSLSYGPVATIGVQNQSYRVTVDYINADTTTVRLLIRKSALHNGKREYVPVSIPVSDPFDPTTVLYEVTRKDPPEDENFYYEEFHIPVYVGIGLRAIANVQVIGGSANISGLGVIGAEAEIGKIRGTLVLQTLGVNGKSIAAALPIQSELNRTTTQNTIVAIASIKTLLYDKNDVTISPRVVGFYLPFPGGQQLVNAIISEISRRNVVWHRPCERPTEEIAP